MLNVTLIALQGFQLLRSILDVEGQFSEARCLKVLPLALAAYQENLPSHYSSQYHESKVWNKFKILAVLHLFDSLKSLELENTSQSITF